jgi:hypothetical protein
MNDTPHDTPPGPVVFPRHDATFPELNPERIGRPRRFRAERRTASVKRVGGAIGEGGAVVAAIRSALSTRAA